MSVIHESFLAVERLSKLDRICVSSFVRPYKDINGRLAWTICQYTFFIGYRYAESGIDGLDKEFKKMYNEKYTRISSKGREKRNRFQDFLEGNSFALDLFKQGMDLYHELNNKK